MAHHAGHPRHIVTRGASITGAFGNVYLLLVRLPIQEQERSEPEGYWYLLGRNSPSAGEMTNGEAPMTNEVRMTHDEHPRLRLAFWLRAWSLIGHWVLGIRHFARKPGGQRVAPS